MIDITDIFAAIEIINAECFFDFLDASIRENHCLSFLVSFEILVFDQLANDFGKLGVGRTTRYAWRRNNQRGARFIDKDRVNLVDNSVVELTLAQLIDLADHVISQVIKPIFIIGSVRNVGIVCFLSGAWFKMAESIIFMLFVRVTRVIHKRLIGHNDRYAEAQEIVNLSHPASITTADIDGDGLIDLFIAGAIDDRGATRNAVFVNRGPAGFVLDTAHPLAAVADVTAALWGDYDNDGLTDVYLCRDGANQLWRQTAKGQWANVTATARADGGGGTTIDGALFDADHDGDLDVLLIKGDGGDELLNNNGDGTFRSLGSKIGLADTHPSNGLIVADLDADRVADIILIKKAAPHVALINDRTWQYHRDPRFGTSAGGTPGTPDSSTPRPPLDFWR